MNRGGRVEATPPESALAAEMFDHFCSAGTMKQILALHREICNTLTLKPNRFPDFYPKLKAKLVNSWKAQALFKKFDARANHKVYGKGRACAQNKVLIIGAGPCGMRAAIECQLLGAKVVVVEKRDRMSRNNVLHLWPFVIQDLRALGAKKFFGKFCAGSIDHISIRQLQCILMKVALLLGVEIHEGVSFEELLEPTVTVNSETLGWRARVSPPEHPVAQYEFDALVGADGKRNTLHGFKRKEFRGKLAMAITANFINRHTEQEASVPEISGVAFIFNQKFFKELYEVTGIDLENIVYYKDDTHYFVMTAKKHSLLDKGVLLNDYAEVSRLLSADNVDRAALMRYAQEAARFSTDGRLPLRDFALNHYGEPDVALFDFTSMYAAENASMVYERHGRKLLCQLVGDSLLEPFWPTGSGCARGFLSALDAAWAVRAWGLAPPPHPLEVIAERESIYRLLAQTTPENLHRDFGAYTLDPGTRYPNLNRTAVTPHRVTSFYDSDEPLPLDAPTTAKKRRREPEVSEETLVSWSGAGGAGGLRAAADAPALAAAVRRYRPDLLPPPAPPRAVYLVLQQEFGITAPFGPNGSPREVADAKLRSYLARVYNAFKGEVPHVHHQSDMFDQIKQSQQKEKHQRNFSEQSVSNYSNTADTDKSHSSYKKKRRSLRTPQVSNDPAEYIRKKIGKLDLNDITQLARLIEGHDAISQEEKHNDKQKELQEQILALLDPEDSPDPTVVRNSLAQLLQGNGKPKVKPKETKRPTTNLAHFFQDTHTNAKPLKPPRRLKGLDADSIRVPDFSDIFPDDSADTDATLVSGAEVPKKKEFSRTPSKESVKRKELKRSPSTEAPIPQARRLSEVIASNRVRNSQSPESSLPYGRSSSLGATEIANNTRRIAQIFEGHKRRHTPSPESRSVRSGSIGNPEMILRRQLMEEIIEGKRRDTPSPDRSKRLESIGNPEMALRKQRVVDLIQGNKPRQSPEPLSQRRNSGEMAFRMQRVSDMIERKSAEAKRPKSGGRRKAAREIMRQRFEKSLQMLATEPRLDFSTTTDLENDYGLQQYRASAPQFDERVKKLEKKLQHYEEGRAVGSGGRTVGGGARVARLAAELSNTNTASASPRSSKPKDLMRSVGKIERDDWNVKEIERKIMENRLGRPEPKTAEKVPKWDREQFLGRQRKLKEGEGGEEKWGEIDETLHKLDQKLRDSGRPDHGTKKVANLATKFVKKEEPEPAKAQQKEEYKSRWRGPATTGMQCAACGARVFAAEGVTADGLHLHRACFRCAVCKAVLRPGNYTMERYGSRLVCLRHSGAGRDAAGDAADAARAQPPPHTPERISLELSDGAREIDEDEWTDRNFLASETSAAGGLSDEEESSSEEYTDAEDSDNEAERSPEPLGVAQPCPQRHLYFSDDSFGYDDYSDDGAESSGNESCSRMRAAREARRLEVPADARPPTDSSEVESEEESESSDEVSSATEVSTDSEFAREECAPVPSPPAILVTEATPPAPPPPQEYPLSRTRSAGGLATKRALELKRKYLLGEPSPPAVRKSDSTSQLDTKLEAFRSTITEFQKMLHPAPSSPNVHVPKPSVTFQFATEERKLQPMPDIIKNLCSDAPVDLLTKGDSPLCKNDWEEPAVVDKKLPEIESDSLSEEDSSHTETGPNKPVPRVEVHDEGGELIQLDSLTLINSGTEDTDEKASGTATTTGPTVIAAESESSESCRDATTLVLTETELSDWAVESAVLDDCHFEERDEKTRSKNPRSLKGPKLVHDAKNVTAISSHVCGRTSPTETVLYCNAADHFEFADEGDQDPSIETPTTPRNEGYMELVDDDYDQYCHSNDRSMNFIERSFSEIVFKPTTATPFVDNTKDKTINDLSDIIEYIDNQDSNSKSENDLKADNSLASVHSLNSEKDTVNKGTIVDNERIINDQKYEENDTKENKALPTEEIVNNITISPTHSSKKEDVNGIQTIFETVSLSEISPPLEKEETELDIEVVIHTTEEGESKSEASIDETSPPLASETSKSRDSISFSPQKYAFSGPCSIRLYSPAICRSASENFNRSNSRSTDSPSRSYELTVSNNFTPDSMSLGSPYPPRDTLDKEGDLKWDREEQPEVLRRLVLDSLREARNFDLSGSNNITLDSISPGSPSPPRDTTEKVQELKREREEQTEVVRRLVLERLGQRVGRKSSRRARMSPVPSAPAAPPPVPPPPALAPPVPPPPRPAPPPLVSLAPLIPVTPSFSDPELARERRRKGIMRSISNYFNRRLGPRHKESGERRCEAHKSTGALQEPPPVPPPPAAYYPPVETPSRNALTASSISRRACAAGGDSAGGAGGGGDAEERDAMQLWFEARWARLVAQRRARDEPRDDQSRRLARLHRRLTRPLSAEQQAAAVAELVQVSAQRDAHQALMAADRRRKGGSVGD